MSARPKVILKLTSIDKIIEISSFLVLAILWFLVAYNYSNLPTIIPIHYNALGEADGFDNKKNIFLLPIIATILFVGMTFLNKYPHIFNYPTNITAENEAKEYTNATKMIRFVKFVIVLMFAWITFQTIRATTLGIWFLPFVSVSTLIPIIFFIIKVNSLPYTKK
jgi:uncharacterized membrane protein